MVHTYGAPNAKFNRFEPRGDNFYQDGGQKGPDLELTINGEKTYVDVSGIADSAMAHKSKFHAAKITVNQKKTQLVRTPSEESDPAPRRPKESPLDERDRKNMVTIMVSRDAKVALAHGARYVPGSFMHNGGMSLIFKNIPSVLQYAMQSAAATIVNAKADYVMKNMIQAAFQG